MLVETGDGDAGAGGHLPGARVDRSERVEPAQVEHDLAVQRHRAADEARVAALGTTATPARLHASSTDATSSTEPGRTTAGVDPEKRPVQSRT